MIVDQAVYRSGDRHPCGDLSDELAALREPGRPDADFLWVGLKDPGPDEFDLVRRELQLHPLAVEDVLHGNQRAKVESYDGTVFAVVKTLRYVEATSDIETGEVMAIIGDHFVVTLRHGDAAPLHSVRARLEQHEQQLLREGPLAVLHGLLDKVVDTYREIDDEVGQDLQAIEMDVFGGGNRTDSSTIYRLKREVLEFRRAALPLRGPLLELSEPDGPVTSPELQLHFRDVADHLDTTLASIDSYDALLTDVLSAHLSQIGVQQNADMRQISAWAAMIAVPTLIAGVYGMNFDHMPELHWVLGYPLAVLLMVVAVLLLRRSFKRSGWL
ncbi:magnesium and cobalt transport protein CorA [Ornithinimicrobium sp. CNJ-824]|uniref:magnesium/cobalt transporter CorA n=1 Tax=Ornithinimicrobium sp. CNJ-824 TaxID=1904966 RepID=UPI00095EB861|nr:magnesium/cobalt transporter CorA [Ornithinimicrobium sp. CNJ-824]OLT22371.1 magnesium and cobalt transport protein CorA [Ornithinimicrobium sp. CNJ-824]